MKILQKTNWKAFSVALKLAPDRVIEKLNNSELKGRSGGNYPAGRKWEVVKNIEAEQKYLICNAHESEPGTFKDRFIMENNPDILIEGIAIACYTMKITKAIIYFKHGYPDLKKKLELTIQKAKPKLKKINLDVEVVLGAGAYICGETTAIIDSIEGLRGEPRKKPPHPTEKGLYGMPTCVNNVETLANIPLILTDKEWSNNLRLFSVSGNVEKPGIYEMPLGVPLKKLMDEAQPSHHIKAVYFGCSGGCLPADDVILEPEFIKEKGAILGNCALIVVSDEECILDITKNIAQFYVHESCGKCTPCREGNFRIIELLEKISEKNATKQELELLEELANFIPETSFCGLGKTSTIHIKTALKYFRSEFEQRCE